MADVVKTGAAKPAAPAASGEDVARAKKLLESYAKITQELGKLVVGQEDVIEQLLIAVLARGHCLLEGVPGLAKTLMVRGLSQVMALSFKRIQFTPDLVPSDLIGVNADTFYEAIIRACVVDPQMSDEQWHALCAALTDRQFDELAQAAWDLNRREVDIPFSRAASRTRWASGAE